MSTYEKIQEAINHLAYINPEKNYYTTKYLQEIDNTFRELKNPKYEYGIMDSNGEVCSLQNANNERWRAGDELFISLDEWIKESPLENDETTVRRLRGKNGLWEKFNL